MCALLGDILLGRCTECGQSLSTPALFPLVYILIVFFARPIIQYKTLGKPYEKWGSKAAAASAVVFVLLNHYQIIAIVGSAEVEVPISCSALTQGVPSPTR